ncbi:hypothetical protein DXT99_19745 [Pontibacter diazotrophicus]|uniref:Uncharacterized protein n=1 Tax=Pontibacter diazotrophicus TaxID=1400979 RepID=A0A3D8L7P2_9BACT|nr:hypothetical protein [Pontibacter diazotrophicus]RDV13425.1 hypothetical protein DXT99_19745 [Pontibacter diazotrophicus]
MRHNDSQKTRRDDGENLGKKDHENELSENPAPKQVDRESENTPPENEVYVNLEPDELYLGEDEEADDAEEKS